MSDPCYGNSACLANEEEGGATYKCVCDESHSGKYCEKTPCYPNPCNYNGTSTVPSANLSHLQISESWHSVAIARNKRKLGIIVALMSLHTLVE